MLLRRVTWHNPHQRRRLVRRCATQHDRRRSTMASPQYVIAIDQGTTSSRAIIFDHAGTIVSVGQAEHTQHLPRPGWVEHDATEIWDNTREVVGHALSRASLTRHDIAAVGITNQRETAVVWDRSTGKPIHHAIVWQDTRTQDLVDRLAAEAPGD